jgi:II/X family phage/plasmid replication protein
VVKLDPDGQIEWQTSCRVQVEGTHEQGISVRSVGGDGQGMATHLSLSGNPSKFLQGHNIFGSDDLMGKRPVSTGLSAAYPLISSV